MGRYPDREGMQALLKAVTHNQNIIYFNGSNARIGEVLFTYGTDNLLVALRLERDTQRLLQARKKNMPVEGFLQPLQVC